ncbi:MAG: choline-sulfatase [Kiritimatiellia bacterium]|jgi:choline-sulfatase
MKKTVKVLVGVFWCAMVIQAAPKPNVLFITIDDLNDWIGCLGGHPQAKTPHIDALARRGVLFTNAHCQAPICNPSRVSFMTGMRPSTSGIYLNNHHFRKSGTIQDAVTLPQHLKAHGYTTYGVGKLFHGSYIDKPSFSEYGPNPGQGPLAKPRITENPSKSGLWDWGPFPDANEKTHDVQDANWAVKQIQAAHEKPFFLGVGFYRPHVPFFAPPEWFEAFPINEIQLPKVRADDRADIPQYALDLTDNSLPPSQEWFVESGEWASCVQAYLASTYFVDHCVGKVIDALDASEHAEDTWIVLLTDHGFFLGEKDRWAKQSLWERATKTPLILVPPKSAGDAFARGKRCARPVELLSLYPTLTALCEVPANERVEGHSLEPLLKNPQADWTYPAITTHQQNNHAVRSEQYRYIHYADGSEELYDHRKDSNEWTNLAGNPELAPVIAEHKKWLPSMNQPAPAGGENKKRKQK